MDRKYHAARAERTSNDSIIEVLDKPGGSLRWSGRLVDYSSTGASFTSGKALAIGTQLHARIRIFGKGWFEVSGKVVRAGKKYGLNLYGVKYSSLKEIFPTGEKKKPDGKI